MKFNLNHILSLKRGVTKYGPAPHKPVLLLAVIEQFELGELHLNWIEPSPELVLHFQDVWDMLVTTPHVPTFALPFFHLSNEKSQIWQLITLPGKEIPVTKSKSIKSYKALCDSVVAARLRDDFYQAILDPINREEIKQALLSSYFPHNALQKRKAKRYSETIKQEILFDPTENYARRIKKKLQELDKELAEQEIVVRGASFKKAIVQIYQHKCAMSGLDIRFAGNVNMVDACHIIPFAESYDDTIRNGIALSPTFHRAFDRGLIAISDSYTTLVHANVQDNSQFHGLREFHGREIILPQNANYYPDLEKLAVHRGRFGF